MPDGSQGLLAADHHHGGVRDRASSWASASRCSAVGGLLGLNRTMALQRADGGRAHRRHRERDVPAATWSPTRRASSATCATFFPPQDGTFLIGPMAKLGWGTPTLVSVALGVDHRDPRQRRHPRRAEDRPARRRRGGPQAPGQLRRRHRVRQASASASSPRCSTRASSRSRSRARWALLAAFGDDANFVLSVGGFHPSFTPPPLPFPTPRRIARRHHQPPLRAHPRRGLLRRHDQHRAVRRPRGARSSASETSASAATSASTRCSSSRRSTSSSRSRASVAEGLRHRRCSASACASRSPGRRRGGPRARARPQLLFFDISADFDITWGEARDTELPDVAVMRAARRRARQAGELARTAAGGQRRCSSRCGRWTRRPTSSSCTRSARCASASAPSRSTSRSPRSATARRPTRSASPSTSRAAASRSAATSTSPSRPPSSRTSTTPRSWPSPPTRSPRRHRAVGERRRAALGPDGQARRALRALHDRHRWLAPPPLPRRSPSGCSPTSWPARRSANSLLSQHREQQAQAVREQGRGGRRRVRGRLGSRQHASSRDASPARRMAQRAPRVPRRRLACTSSRPTRRWRREAARDLLVPALAAQRPRRPDHRGRPDAGVHGRATVRVELELSGQPREGSTTLTAPAQRDVALYGPGDVVGIDARAIVRTRAARLDHELRARTTCPTSSSTTRTSPGATRPPRPTRAGSSCGRGSRSSCSRTASSSDGPFSGRGAPLPFVDGHERRASFPVAERPVGLGARPREPTLAASDGEFVSTDMRGRLRRLQSRARRQPRPRVLAHRLPAPAEGEHRLPRVRRAGVRDRAPGRPRPRSRRSLRARRPRPGRPTTASRTPTALSRLPPLVLPHRRGAATSSTWSGCWSRGRRQARRRARHGRPPARLQPARHRRRGPRRISGSAARCASRATRTRHEERAALERFDKWAQRPARRYPQPFQQKLAAFVNLADDYAAARRPSPPTRPLTSASRSRATPTR